MSNNSKVVKFHPKLHSTFGIFMGIILLIYLFVQIFSYVTDKSISVYEVPAGTIALNTHYKALAIRQETIISAPENGYPIYYSKNGSVAGKKTIVYAIDTNGSVAGKLNNTENDIEQIDDEDMLDLQNLILNFQKAYQTTEYARSYNFYSDLSDTLEQSIRLGATESLSTDISAAIASNTYHNYIAEAPGYLLYSMDGGEGLTVDELRTISFDSGQYTTTDLRTTDQLNSGDPVYKLVTSDNWTMVMEISSDLEKRLIEDETTYIEVQFDDDASRTWAACSTFKKDGNIYLQLDLDDSVERYADQRFVSIELLLDETSGLKIPNSAITEKEFYLVPTMYFYNGNNSSEIGVMIRSDEGDTFVAPSLYKLEDDCYYVDPEELAEGSMILMPDSGSTFIIGEEKRTLQGVYNVNRGYAIFRPIEILYSNQDYSIISSNTSYGVDLYDHIALDGEAVQEDEVIY